MLKLRWHLKGFMEECRGNHLDYSGPSRAAEGRTAPQKQVGGTVCLVPLSDHGLARPQLGVGGSGSDGWLCSLALAASVPLTQLVAKGKAWDNCSFVHPADFPTHRVISFLVNFTNCQLVF